MEQLADIATFVKVVDLGSFTAAAEVLETSQPVVSKAVMRLAQRLGARLLNRTTRRLSLTEAGAQLYAQGAKAIAALDNVQLEIARFQTPATLRVLPKPVCRSSAWMTSTPNAVARCLNCGHFSTS
jgi:DNA-binding transcriptional LysR family regulator